MAVYYQTHYESPLGQITLASDGKALKGLWIRNQKYFGSSVKAEMMEDHSLPVFLAAKQWLDRYFAGERPEISKLPLAPEGSEFRREVWKILCRIPYGETITYGEIAKQIAEIFHKPRMSAQAVGGAVGHNPISIIIPCHRVVGTGGNLTGYAGGLDLKVRLLELEGADMSGFYLPKDKAEHSKTK